MREIINKLIKQYIDDYTERVETDWREPIIKFAAADDDLFYKLKEVVSPEHILPEELLPDAKTVITYFLPFSKQIAESNIKGKYSSKRWAVAYLESNELIYNLNNYLDEELLKKNYKTSFVPATHNFDEKKLISHWSHRHVGYIAGLGKFGINNMLITDSGCCGRVGSIVTNMKITPSRRDKKEYCLYKHNSSCGKCIERCINGALKINSFDRFKCYEVLLKNDGFHSKLGLTDVCGKCCVNLPCSFNNPVGKLRSL